MPVMNAPSEYCPTCPTCGHLVFLTGSSQIVPHYDSNRKPCASNGQLHPGTAIVAPPPKRTDAERLDWLNENDGLHLKFWYGSRTIRDAVDLAMFNDAHINSITHKQATPVAEIEPLLATPITEMKFNSCCGRPPEECDCPF